MIYLLNNKDLIVRCTDKNSSFSEYNFYIASHGCHTFMKYKKYIRHMLCQFVILIILLLACYCFICLIKYVCVCMCENISMLATANPFPDGGLPSPYFMFSFPFWVLGHRSHVIYYFSSQEEMWKGHWMSLESCGALMIDMSPKWWANLLKYELWY